VAHSYMNMPRWTECRPRLLQSAFISLDRARNHSHRRRLPDAIRNVGPSGGRDSCDFLVGQACCTPLPPRRPRFIRDSRIANSSTGGARGWALRLARPELFPMARQAFAVLSSNRRRVSRPRVPMDGEAQRSRVERPIESHLGSKVFRACCENLNECRWANVKGFLKPHAVPGHNPFTFIYSLVSGSTIGDRSGNRCRQLRTASCAG
jgi:hypothetical protein